MWGLGLFMALCLMVLGQYIHNRVIYARLDALSKRADAANTRIDTLVKRLEEHLYDSHGETL